VQGLRGRQEAGSGAASKEEGRKKYLAQGLTGIQDAGSGTWSKRRTGSRIW